MKKKPYIKIKILDNVSMKINPEWDYLGFKDVAIFVNIILKHNTIYFIIVK